MAVRKPLVNLAGRMGELPMGDSIPTSWDSAYRSGRDITLAITASAPGTLACTANNLRANPFFVRSPITVSGRRYEVTTALAASTFRAGLYSDSNGYPNALITGSDTGTISSAAVGVVSALYGSNIVLQPGLYWQVLSFSGAVALRSIVPAAINPILGWNPAGGTTGNYTGLLIAAAYAALPTTFPAGAALTGNTAAPLGLYRMV